MTPPSRRIALFGGSFDPVHPAHLAIAQAAVAQAGLDEVIFLPAAQSPLKSHGPVASGPLRVEMLEAAIRDAGLSWASVSSWELERPGPSYSWQTARHFCRQGDAGTAWFWLMGVDQWEQLEYWQQWPELARLVTFLVFTREGRAPSVRPGVASLFLAGEFPGSSTTVRRSRHHGTDWEAAVPPGVAAIIQREALYLG